jgi:hypothetical protein
VQPIETQARADAVVSCPAKRSVDFVVDLLIVSGGPAALSAEISKVNTSSLAQRPDAASS